MLHGFLRLSHMGNVYTLKQPKNSVFKVVFYTGITENSILEFSLRYSLTHFFLLASANCGGEKIRSQRIPHEKNFEMPLQ
jgi:hypothetical protein